MGANYDNEKSHCTDQPPYQFTTDDVEDVLDATEQETASEKTKETSAPCVTGVRWAAAAWLRRSKPNANCVS